MFSPEKEKKSLKIYLQLCRCGCINYLTAGETYRAFLMQRENKGKKNSLDHGNLAGEDGQGHYLTFEMANNGSKNSAASSAASHYEEVGFDLRLNLDKLLWVPPGLTIEEVRLSSNSQLSFKHPPTRFLKRIFNVVFIIFGKIIQI